MLAEQELILTTQQAFIPDLYITKQGTCLKLKASIKKYRKLFLINKLHYI